MKKALFLYASIGAGHLRAAQALQGALQERRPDWQFEMVDALKLMGKLVKGIYKDWYGFAIRRVPVAWKYIYKETEDFRRFQQVVYKPRQIMEEINSWRLERYLDKLSPDIIINTHHLPLGMVSFWRQHNKVEVPLSLAVLTDYSGHRFWVHPRVDRYYVATREVGAYIEAQGVSPALIKPFGIPIGEQFQKRLDSQKLRARYHLDRDMPTVLLIVDNIEKIFLTKMIQSLLRFKPALQGFIIAGMPKTRALLETALKGSRHRLRVIDRVPNLEEYCSLADVLVSKAGGLTIAETLALGLPLLIVNPIMGQEETNRNFLLEQGAALNVEIPDLLEYKLNLFFHDAALRTRLCKNIAALARPRAAEDTAADIISLAENKL